MQPIAATLSRSARPPCHLVCPRGDTSSGGSVLERLGVRDSTVERLADGVGRVARLAPDDGSSGGKGAPVPDGGRIIRNIEDLLGGELELELDDPAMLGRDARNFEVGPDGRLVSVNAYRDIDAPLFDGGADVSDIDQGQIADCYLMAALASLAHTDPGYVENMITDNGNGTYTVHFGGELGDVTVDDDFAVDRNGRPLYAQVDTGDGSPELWVAVIEKAFAQASGGYGPIEFGWANEAITAMTGHDDFTVAAPSAFAPDTLHTALAEGRSVTALSFPGEKGEKIGGETGVVTNHVYAVLDVREVDGETQVRVYNPHGRGGEPIGSDAENDGAFWMSWDDFASSFRAVEVMNTPLPCAA